MKTYVTKGIVLARTNFQEADRIVTLLTPDRGKVRVVAKGVRKPKSKMAGGIELFSIGDITYLPGRGELATLISSRLLTNFGNIVQDIDRTMYGYDMLKRFNKITEDDVESSYFELLDSGLASLNDPTISLEITDLWVSMQLLKLTGHLPNLLTDTAGKKLTEQETYVFSFDDMAFAPVPQGSADAKLIKFLRLAASQASSAQVSKVQGTQALVAPALKLVRQMVQLSLPT